MVASEEVVHTVRTSAAYGVKAHEPTVDLAAVIQRKRSVVLAAREMNLHNLETALDGNLIIGTARFVDPMTIEVVDTEGNIRLLAAERLFINTGTRPLIPPVPGLKETGFLTSESIMQLEQLPEHLIVLGSGYIGLEFAQMFRRFGSRVTVIGQSEQILSQQAPDIAIAVQTLLERDGIEFLLKAKVLSVARAGTATRLQIQVADREISLQGSQLLVAHDRLIPSCLFINPELAHVGLTETEAQQQGYNIRVAKLDASAIPRARTSGQTDGLLKAIVDSETGRILGCSLLCHAAGEVISTVQMVMQAKLPYTVLHLRIFVLPHLLISVFIYSNEQNNDYLSYSFH